MSADLTTLNTLQPDVLISFDYFKSYYAATLRYI